MPCTYTGSLDGDRIMGLEQANASARKALDEMTALACAAFTVLDSEGLLDKMTARQVRWWADHKAADRKREEEAEAKFSPGTQVYIAKVGAVKTVVSSSPDGHPDDRKYVLEDAKGVRDEGWREYELEEFEG